MKLNITSKGESKPVKPEKITKVLKFEAKKSEVETTLHNFKESSKAHLGGKIENSRAKSPNLNKKFLHGINGNMSIGEGSTNQASLIANVNNLIGSTATNKNCHKITFSNNMYSSSQGIDKYNETYEYLQTDVNDPRVPSNVCGSSTSSLKQQSNLLNHSNNVTKAPNSRNNSLNKSKQMTKSSSHARIQSMNTSMNNEQKSVKKSQIMNKFTEMRQKKATSKQQSLNNSIVDFKNTDISVHPGTLSLNNIHNDHTSSSGVSREKDRENKDKLGLTRVSKAVGGIKSNDFQSQSQYLQVHHDQLLRKKLKERNGSCSSQNKSINNSLNHSRASSNSKSKLNIINFSNIKIVADKNEEEDSGVEDTPHTQLQKIKANLISLVNKQKNKQEIIEEIKKLYDYILTDYNIEKLKEENLELTDKNEKYSREVGRLNGKVSSLKKENNWLKQRLEESETKLKSFQQFLNHFQGEISSFNATAPLKEQKKGNAADIQMKKETQMKVKVNQITEESEQDELKHTDTDYNEEVILNKKMMVHNNKEKNDAKSKSSSSQSQENKSDSFSSVKTIVTNKNSTNAANQSLIPSKEEIEDKLNKIKISDSVKQKQEANNQNSQVSNNFDSLDSLGLGINDPKIVYYPDKVKNVPSLKATNIPRLNLTTEKTLSCEGGDTHLSRTGNTAATFENSQGKLNIAYFDDQLASNKDKDSLSGQETNSIDNCSNNSKASLKKIFYKCTKSSVNSLDLDKQLKQVGKK